MGPTAKFDAAPVDWRGIAPFIHRAISGRDCARLQTGCLSSAMKPRGLAIAVASVIALGASAFAAHAEDGRLILASDADFAVPSLGVAASAPRRTLQWDASKGRWGLSLGVEQHFSDRDVQFRDVSPGVYYRLTRRLHIGGAVSLAPDEIQGLRLGQPQLPAPRVRLETVFKF